MKYVKIDQIVTKQKNVSGCNMKKLILIFNKFIVGKVGITAGLILLFSHGILAAQDRLIDVDGYKIQYEEYGSGKPVVVFLNGGSAKMSYWNTIIEPVSNKTRVILYERGGHENSEMGKMPRHGINIADELNVLLRQLNVISPYILVAHSAGCMYARIYASRYSDDVAGLILLDPGDEDFLDSFGEKYLKGDDKKKWQKYWSETWTGLAERKGGFGQEVREKSKTIMQMNESKLSDNLFYYVLSGLDKSRPDYFIVNYSKKVINDYFNYQEEYHESLVKGFTRGKLIKVEDSQHVIHHDRPDIVISTVGSVIDSVKLMHNNKN